MIRAVTFTPSDAGLAAGAYEKVGLQISARDATLLLSPATKATAEVYAYNGATIA